MKLFPVTRKSVLRALPATAGLLVVLAMTPQLCRSLISNLAQVATVQVYHLQKDQCAISPLVTRPALSIRAPERLAMALAGVDSSPGDMTLEFGAQDFSFEPTWALQLRDLATDFGPTAPRCASPVYLRFWSNASARVVVQARPGCYQVTVLGMEDAPGPVWLKVFANHRPLADLWFCRSDNTWSEQSLIVTPSFWLLAGEPADELILEFAFANDGPDARGLRDAGVALVRISPVDCLASDGVTGAS